MDYVLGRDFNFKVILIIYLFNEFLLNVCCVLGIDLYIGGYYDVDFWSIYFYDIF